MAIKSDAQRQAVQRYNKKNYDQVVLRIKKGTRDRLADYAREHGYKNGVSQLIKEALSEKMGETIE